MGIVRTLLFGREHGLRVRLRRRLRRLLGRLAGQPPGTPAAPASPARTAPPTAPAAPVPAGQVGFFAVARLADLPPGGVREVLVAGRPVALARVGDAVHAFEGTCPHAGGPLAEGRLVGTTLTCPMHGWSFDVVTGACHVNPQDRIRILPVRVVDGEIRVEV